MTTIIRAQTTDIALIVFGPNRHASRFPSADAGAAADLARSLKMQSVRVTTDRLREVAQRLPPGKLSAKGLKAIQVQPALYKQLLAIADSASPSSSDAAKTQNEASSEPKLGSPGNSNGLVRGSIVLAADSLDEGFWPARVEHVDVDIVTLRWVDWDTLPKFNKHLDQVTPYPRAKPC
jgi:hypothetical protein